MRQEAIESWKHKKYDVRIYQDENNESSPDDDKNKDLFLVGFHSDFTVNREGFEKSVCQYLAGDKDQTEDVVYRAKEVAKKYHTFGLEAYIHSGVVLALSQEGNFCDRQWDVSQLGLVFVSKKEWKTSAKAKEAARSLIKEWNSSLSGEVYGFAISQANKCKTCGHVEEETKDSCWGFVGDIKYCIEAAKDAVKGL